MKILHRGYYLVFSNSGLTNTRVDVYTLDKYKVFWFFKCRKWLHKITERGREPRDLERLADLAVDSYECALRNGNDYESIVNRLNSQKL